MGKGTILTKNGESRFPKTYVELIKRKSSGNMLGVELDAKIERVELECLDDTNITIKGDSTPLTYDQIKALVDNPRKFVTLLYMEIWWMLPSYDDGGAIMFTSTDIEGGHPVITRVVMNTDSQMNNYSIVAEDSDHKTDNLHKEVALDGHKTYPTTSAVNKAFGGSYAVGNSRTATDLLPTGATSHVEFLQRDSKQEGVVNITKLMGKTLAWNQQIKPKNGTITNNGITFTFNTNGSVKINGTATGRATAPLNMSDTVANDIYLNLSGNDDVDYLDGYVTWNNNTIRTQPRARGYSLCVDTGITIDATIYPILVDLTQMFGAGNEPSTIEELNSIVDLTQLSQESGKLISFEPHKITSSNADNSESVTLDLSFVGELRSAGNVADEYDTNKGVIIRRIGVKVFDGSETWSMGEAGKAYTSVLAPTIKGGGGIISNYYPSTSGWGMNGIFVANSKNVCIEDSVYTSASAFNSHLAELYAQGNPLTVYYELVTPYTEEIGDHNLSYHIFEYGHEVVDSPVKMIADVKEGKSVAKVVADEVPVAMQAWQILMAKALNIPVDKLGVVDLGTLDWEYGGYTINTWSNKGIVNSDKFIAFEYTTASWGAIDIGHITHTQNIIIINTGSNTEKPKGYIFFEKA